MKKRDCPTCNGGDRGRGREDSRDRGRDARRRSPSSDYSRGRGRDRRDDRDGFRSHGGRDGYRGREDRGGRDDRNRRDDRDGGRGGRDSRSNSRGRDDRDYGRQTKQREERFDDRRSNGSARDLPPVQAKFQDEKPAEPTKEDMLPLQRLDDLLDCLENECKYHVSDRKDVVVVFTADNEGWKSMSSKFVGLAKHVNRKLIVYETDPAKAPEIAEKYSISAEKLPAVMFFRDKAELDRFVDPKFDDVEKAILELAGMDTPVEQAAEPKEKAEQKQNPEVEAEERQGSPPRD
jgi:hypothetical protein